MTGERQFLTGVGLGRGSAETWPVKHHCRRLQLWLFIVWELGCQSETADLFCSCQDKTISVFGS